MMIGKNNKMKVGLSEIQEKKITVLGAATSGLAVADLLHRHGAKVFVSEKAPESEKQDAVQRLARSGIPAEFGGHSARALDADWLVVSPGIAPDTPILEESKKRGIQILGELEVASWFSKAPIVAVTGSNGKSTVTALIGESFKKSGRPTVVAGNIGQAFSEKVEKAVPEGVAVIEVSSFQLETIRTFRPKVAVFLNLTQDHINWHGSFEAYGKAKARIFKNQTVEDHLVLFGQDRGVLDLSLYAKPNKVLFGMSRTNGPNGFVQNGVLTLHLSDHDESILTIEELGIRGEHNVLNALASALACRLMGVEIDAIRNVFKTFKGLPHRLEFVIEKNGVRWINDSKGTNVDSVWYALGSFQQPIVLIAGGRDKDSDFTVLRERLKKSARTILLIGEAADKMERAFQGICPLVRAGSLREAIGKARDLSQPGDVVMLSPACASFDMFKNFEDRGDQFKFLVREIVGS
jgi:UDP-N-acetylmuramoylalanine--D-glutamate ligase